MCENCMETMSSNELLQVNRMVDAIDAQRKAVEDDGNMTGRLELIFSAANLLILAGFVDMALIVETGEKAGVSLDKGTPVAEKILSDTEAELEDLKNEIPILEEFEAMLEKLVNELDLD